ncbi:MAG: hypothetical protein IKH38_01310 [Clostridia bacterium]|nr:hypothetical protein [Clostridia bacterium]
MRWLWAALAFFVALVIVALRMREKRQREEELVARVRDSSLYACLYPILMQYSQAMIEQLAVREDEVFLRMMRPGREVHFHFETQGFDPPSPAARLALAQAIAQDLPGLQEPARYVFSSHRHELPNGERSVWYDYVLTVAEKSRLLNLPSRRSRVGEE